MKKKIFIAILAIITIILVAYLILRLPPLKVVATLPKDQTHGVSIDANIIFTFNREPTGNEKKNISANIAPFVKTNLLWNKQLLTITPVANYAKQTTYSVSLFYLNQNLSTFSFTTLSYTTQELNNIENQQSQNDLLFGQQLSDFLKTRPWFTSLPIDSANYTIVYDFAKQAFRIRLKVAVSGNTQEQQLINQALNALKQIGVKDNPIPYYVLTQ